MSDIFEAAKTGQLDQISLDDFIRTGVNLNDTDSQGITALCYAIQGRYGTTVKLLLEKGADPNAASSNNRTPLWFAASAPRTNLATPIVTYLLQNGSRPNAAATDADGYTPLLKAIVESKNEKLVNELLTHGSTTTSKAKNGKDAVQLANEFGTPEIKALVATAAAAEASGQKPQYPGGGTIGTKETVPVDTVLKHIANHIIKKSERGGQLSGFYPGTTVQDIQKLQSAKDAAVRGAKLAEHLLGLKIPGLRKESAAQAGGILALYDLAVLLDDSFSMEEEEEGKRITTLQQMLRLIAKKYSLVAEPDRKILAVRWFNSNEAKNNVSEETASAMVNDHEYGSLTRIGSALKNRILTPLLTAQMTKPLLVMVISDGEVDGERVGLLESVIKDAIAQAKAGTVGKGAASVSFQFSRIGNDEGAKKLLERLDTATEIAEYVDTQPARMNLDDAVARGEEEAAFSIVKLLLGAISNSWDEYEFM